MTEIELKLEISPADLEKIALSSFLGQPAATRELHSVYFDTGDCRLFDHGFTLRIRRSGEKTIQTVKATGSNASLFARSEWETPARTNTPVFDYNSPLLNRFGPIERDLVVQFEVVTNRRIWNLTEGTSSIEVAADTGIVMAGDRQAPFHEIELELKGGDPRQLFALARKINAIVPVKIGVQSKSERGYRLLSAMRNAAKAEAIGLEPRLTADEGFRMIALSCFRQFRLNETLLLQKGHAGSLHQARVAIRRLRSALSLFKPLLDENAKRFSDEFRWLANTLGDARNLDVLLLKAADGELWEKLETARKGSYAEIVEALASDRSRALMLDFNEWLLCGYYAKHPDGEKPVEDFAAKALDRMRKKLKKHGRDLAEIDDEHRHEARKDAKKLRYAAEFFAPLFADKRGLRRYKNFNKAMEALQDRLGALNDLAIGHDVLKQYGIEETPEAQKLIFHADKKQLIEKAQTALDDVLDAKKFWR
ncbi:CHAD domain-containing protein [Ochrobactrum teleogrylli]|uniref:CYTH and CHAD domain-containing protein n=1 Tax=Ochrobactrum teleogrylli TaxID=2479765 RepID=UPI00384F48B7